MKYFFFLMLATLAYFSTPLDLKITSYFYQGDGQFSSYPLFTALYNYGTYPAWIVALGSLFLLPWKAARPYCFVFLFTFAIGSGVIVNGLLKEQWGRPRPKQTIAFGGMQPFRPFYSPQFTSQPEPSKSFSCGHCTMGFVFFAWILAGQRKGNKILFWLGILLTLTLGIGLSLTRIAQGGHYFSDVAVSAIIMWGCATLACHLFILRKKIPAGYMSLTNR